MNKIKFKNPLDNFRHWMTHGDNMATQARIIRSIIMNSRLTNLQIYAMTAYFVQFSNLSTECYAEARKIRDEYQQS